MLHPKNDSIIMLATKPDEVMAYAWPGGYPIFYMTEDAGVLCPPCVGENIDDCCDPDNSQYHVAAHSANFENPTLFCDDCGKRIESAYADG